MNRSDLHPLSLSQKVRSNSGTTLLGLVWLQFHIPIGRRPPYRGRPGYGTGIQLVQRGHHDVQIPGPLEKPCGGLAGVGYPDDTEPDPQP